MADTIEHQFTTAEAVAFIKAAKRGSDFALSIRNDAPIPSEPGRCFSGALCGYMTITRPQALRLAASLLSPTLEGRGARLPVRVTSYSDKLTYWIGA